MVTSSEYGTCSQIQRQEKQHAKSALLTIALIACSCIVLSVVIVTSGRGGDDVVSLFGGFTSHLDLDHGALAALEATAGESNDDDGYSSAYSDASPRVPQILSAQFQRSKPRAISLRSQGRDQMLSDESSRQEKKQEAEEGLHTQDYNYLTDAAGTM